MTETPNYFAIIPANVRYDKRLKPNEKLLFAEITALCNKTGECWATNQYFADLYEVHKNTIGNWINHLKELNYLDVRIIYREGTKEIVKRVIRLSCCPSNQKIDTYQSKDCDPLNKNIDTPINEIIEGNNTRMNNTRLIIKEKQEKEKNENFKNQNSFNSPFSNSSNFSPSSNSSNFPFEPTEHLETKNSKPKEQKPIENQQTKSPPLDQTTKLNTLDKLKLWWEWWETNNDKSMDTFQEEYKLDYSILKRNYEALILYCESKGKTYKDYKAAFKNFILKDLNNVNNQQKWSRL